MRTYYIDGYFLIYFNELNSFQNESYFQYHYESLKKNPKRAFFKSLHSKLFSYTFI